MDQISRQEELINKYKYPGLISIVGLVLILGGLFTPNLLTNFQPQKAKTYPKEALVDKSQLLIKVDVSGQVSRPGVYSLASDARVEDAIKAAGGVTSQVDSQFLTKTINLAQKISDGMKIYIPSINENSSPNLAPSLSNANNSAININQADTTSLDKLPGIGQVTAQKIIENRPYSTIEELLAKKVVSKSVFETIKDKISVF